MMRKQLGTILALIPLVIWVIVAEFQFRPEGRIFYVPPLDLAIYILAGHHLRNGGNLYEGNYIYDLPFTYPPFAGVLFQGFTFFGNLEATLLWQGANLLALMAVIWMITRSIPISVLLAIASVGLDAVHGSFFYGQINAILMFLVALDFLPKNRRFAGIGVGLAAGIKLTPAFFVLIFLIERRWKAVFVSAGTFLTTVLIGWLFVPDASRFWFSAIKDSSRVGDHTNAGAQSLRSVLERVYHAESWWIPAVIITMIIICFGIWLAVKNHDMVWALIIAGFGACLVSPFTWFHHWMWIVPLAAVLIRKPWDNQWLQVAAVYATTLFLLPHMAPSVSPYTTFALSGTNPMFISIGYLAIFGYIGYVFVQGRRRQASV